MPRMDFSDPSQRFLVIAGIGILVLVLIIVLENMGKANTTPPKPPPQKGGGGGGKKPYRKK